jgi:phosphoribosylglycinamide formyltransferase-1
MTDNASPKARLCVLISGSGSNLQAIMDACRGHILDATVVQVISNRADAHGLIRAQQAHIPTEVLNHKTFADRPGFDAALADHIDQCNPDFVVLAGFMRILTPGFVERFLGRLINIHPSLLPKYPGLDTHARALVAGDQEHGATVHFVTPTVDAGPPIVKGILNVLPDDSVDTLKARIHQLEHVIYPHALDQLIKGNVCYRQQQAYWTDGRESNSPDIIRL